MEENGQTPSEDLLHSQLKIRSPSSQEGKYNHGEDSNQKTRDG
jgi:hypothetical protein